MAKRRKRGRRKTRRKVSRRRSHRPLWIRLGVLALVFLAGWIIFLDFKVQREFAGKRWSLPARVYARPLELYSGLELTPEQLVTELKALHYRPVQSPRDSGQFSRNRNNFHLISRAFEFWDGEEPPRSVRLAFRGGKLSGLTDADSGQGVSLLRLDPVLVGSFYPCLLYTSPSPRD